MATEKSKVPFTVGVYDPDTGAIKRWIPGIDPIGEYQCYIAIACTVWIIGVFVYFIFFA